MPLIIRLRNKPLLFFVTLCTVLVIAGCAAFTSVNDQLQERQISTIMQNTRSQLQLGHTVRGILDQAKVIPNKDIRKQFLSQKISQVAQKYNPEQITQKVHTNTTLIVVCFLVIGAELLFIIICLSRRSSYKHQ